MKRLFVFSGIAVVVSIATVSIGDYPMSTRIRDAVILYYAVLIVLETSRDAIIEIRKEWRRGYGRKRNKAR